jgi:hypothetical protein
MRLRSSQFVFLMLLVCSVQIRQEYALQLITDAISGRTASPSQTGEVAARSAKPSHSLASQPREHIAVRLAPAARAAHRTAWTMPHPASASSAVASFTGFLRA